MILKKEESFSGFHVLHQKKKTNNSNISFQKKHSYIFLQ